ncbi:MAG TPA: L,D-transpeptidase [Polyangiaceae bacterium]|nr:L,D-transpeptidase [Polyangiaceae bacterium]
MYPAPGRGRGPVGVVRPGTSIALLDDEPRPGKGCRGGWLAAAPAGFLCNGENLSADPGHPMAAAAIAELVRPSGEGVLPYRYAFSRGAPMYGRLPTEAEQERVEGPPERRARARKPKGGFGGHDELTVEDPIEAEGELPAALAEGRALPSPRGETPLVRKWLPEGSTVAFARAFRAEGRTWLVSTDLSLVPADRVLAYRVSSFQGVRLGGGARLPIAWARRAPRPFYRREAGGRFVPTGESLGARERVALSAERATGARGAYLRVEGEGERYLAEADVAVARERPPPPGVGAGEKWVDIRLREGTLVAYEGARPVFATLVAGGAGGPGAPGDTDRELVDKSATPVGTYRVSWKVSASRMTPEKGEPERFWLAEVPHTLYFRAPFAIHTAYWHEDFGVPKSAGCVNVSPADGKFLFEWADPPLPPGWQGVGPGRETGLGTRVVLAP